MRFSTIFAVMAVVAASASVQAAGIEERAACQVIVSQKTVHSEEMPRGNIPAIVVKGSRGGSTPGGNASPDERCAYFYGPDIRKGSSKPTYSGGAWPYIIVPSGCSVVLDSSVPVGSKLRQTGFVSVQSGTGILLIGGLPTYQYDADSVGNCLCNIPGSWTTVDATGKGAAISVKYPKQ